jgi:hypothetical protein
MSMEHWLKDTDRGKWKYYEENLFIPMPVFLPQILPGLAWDPTAAFSVTGRKKKI